MNTTDTAYYNSICTLKRGELIEKLMAEHLELVELRAKEKANEKIYTEIFISHNDLETKFEALRQEYEVLKKQLEKEIEKNALKNKSTFGRSTEKYEDLVSSASDKPEEFEDESQIEDEDENGDGNGRIVNFPTGGSKKDKSPEGKSGHGTKRGKNALNKSLDNLPVKIQYDLDIDQLNEMFGEGNWKIVGWREHRTLEAIPLSFFVLKTITPIIKENGRMYTVPYANLLLSHSYASPSALAFILYRKFVLGLPFYRQAVDFQMSGLCLSKQDLIHWANTAVPTFLDMVWEYMVTRLVSYKYIQSDETYILVNKDGRKAGRKSFMWVHCSSECCDCNPIIIFCYEATRNTDHLRAMLAEFMGYITCDAYISYQVMEGENDGIIVSGCLMHCRRYFAEAFFVNDVASMSDEELAAMPELKVLQLIKEVYIEENKLKNLTADERTDARQKDVKPKMDALMDYIHELADSDEVYSDRMQKAINYAINQEDRLRVFLSDGNIPCDNGHSERIIRSYSVGRVNWLFADTIPGAKVNATVYSITETAKANNANPQIYLQYLFEKIPARIEINMPTDDDFMETMMPWSDQYRQYEKNTRDHALREYSRMFPRPPKPPRPKSPDISNLSKSRAQNAPPSITA